MSNPSVGGGEGRGRGKARGRGRARLAEVSVDAQPKPGVTKTTGIGRGSGVSNVAVVEIPVIVEKPTPAVVEILTPPPVVEVNVWANRMQNLEITQSGNPVAANVGRGRSERKIKPGTIAGSGGTEGGNAAGTIAGRGGTGGGNAAGTIAGRGGTGGGNTAGAIAGRGGMRNKRAVPQNTICTRPEIYKNSKKGESGTVVKLQANYFSLKTQTKWTLYQYRVDVSPEEERTFVRKNLLRDQKNILGGYIFDGTVMYTPHKLDSDPKTLYSKRSEDGEIMKITLKLVGDVTPGDYVYIQVFNILMRKCYASLKLQLLNRDFYDKAAKIDIQEYKMQIWPGYKTTISQYESSLLMVAEITHKIIRTDTVIDMLREFEAQYGKGNCKNHFNKQIIGQIVLTDYNNNTYRINDVNWECTPMSKFSMNDEEITYVEYYRRKYQLTIKDKSQPLLVSLAKPRDIRRGLSEMVLLVPEFCRMTGLTDKMRNDFHLMKAISTHTRVGPAERIKKLIKFNERLCTSKESVNQLKEWNMQLDTKLVEFNARQLPPEVIVQRNIKYQAGNTNEGWSKNLRSNPFLTYGEVKSWVVITVDRNIVDTRKFVKLIHDASRGMKFAIPDPTIHQISNDTVATFMNKIEEILSIKQPTFMLCVLSNWKADVYNAIKRKCSVDRNVPTQVVLLKTANHKSGFSIATKVAIQVNCKIGGSPWGVSIPIPNLMVVGYDVCHDPRSKQQSYGAMVASMDQSQTQYFSCVTRHSNGEELANEFCINIKKAVQEYRNKNSKLPGMIVIYRDGVGEGQISYVYTHEIEIIKKSLSELYGPSQYKLSFVVVTKRLNTRFFYNNANPSPGTVIDDVITSPERYDFFLISQAVREGTVAPTSYNILFDNTGLTPDRAQRLAYKLCHIYFNFSGQIRVPAPCQYAHKLAFMASQSYGNPPNLGLSHLLHFL